MFREDFEQYLNKKSKSDFASIAKSIKADSSIRTPRPSYLLAGISAAIITITVVALSITLPSLGSMTYRTLNHPRKPFNEYGDSPSQNYTSSLMGFASSIGTMVAEENQNFVASPLSIATTFSMAYEGANGKTKDELAAMLGYGSSFEAREEIQKMFAFTSGAWGGDAGPNSSFCINASNAYFVDKSFENNINEEYLGVLQDYYYAEAYCGSLNTDTMHELLASWMNEKTYDTLHATKEDFSNYDGAMWLVNAIYMQNIWANGERFEKASPITFYNENKTETPDVPAIHAKLAANVHTNDSFLVIHLPLCEGYELRIIYDIPSDEPPFVEESFKQRERFYYEALLDPLNKLAQGNTQVREIIAELDITMPKWSTSTDIDLHSVLDKNGILTTSFSETQADFSGMLKQGSVGDLYIKWVKHQAAINVYEEGVTASAFTGMIIYPTGLYIGNEEIEVTLDHPFHYAAVHRSGLPLFVGRLANMNS